MVGILADFLVADIRVDVLEGDIPLEHGPAADNPGVDSLEEDIPAMDCPVVDSVGVDSLVAGTLEVETTGLGRKTVVAGLDEGGCNFEVGEDVGCAPDRRSDELVGEVDWTG